MNRNVKYMALAVLISMVSAVSIQAQDAPGGFKAMLPEVALNNGVSVPVGDLGNALALGYSGNQSFSVAPIPDLFKEQNMLLRTGIMSGFAMFNTESAATSGTISQVPVLAFVTMEFLTDLPVIPFVRVGTGVTFSNTTRSLVSTAGSQKALSSVDFTLNAALGAKYRLPDLPISISLEGFYNGVFQKTIGHYAGGNLGVHFHLY